MSSELSKSSVTIFEMSPIRFSSRWGSSWNQWSEAFEPETTIQFFSSNSGQKTVNILSEKGAELNSISVDADKGFNYVSYNLELTQKGKKALTKENEKLEFNETGNKKYYLPKGKYTVAIDKASITFEIK
jgi:hypothetical protein